MADSMSPLFDSEIRRIDEVEEMMSSGIQTRRVAPLVARKFGITRRHAQRYVRAVIERWKAESAATRDEKRAQIEATLWALYRAAMRRKSVHIQRVGADEPDRVIERPDPDIRGGHDALKTIGMMHGLIGPDIKIEQGPTTVNVLVMDALQKAFGYTPPEAIESDTVKGDGKG